MTFRRELARLIAGLEGVLAVVVFVDDLDRCLPDTVVDTFETIRLFLNTPKTAYVVAANQRVIESSVDARYPGLRDENGEGLGSAYLEKMLQMKVAVPALSPPEAETYMNLLLAELHLSADEFAKVRGEAAKLRSDNNLQVAFNLGHGCCSGTGRGSDRDDQPRTHPGAATPDRLTTCRIPLCNPQQPSGRRGTRTPDHWHVRPVLYQLSYAPVREPAA